MPVQDSSEDEEVPPVVQVLLEDIENEFAHENCLFLASQSFNSGIGEKDTIWMYYPNNRENPELCPDSTTFLAEITSFIKERVDSVRYSHVAGMEADDYPESAPDKATELTKIHI